MYNIATATYTVVDIRKTFESFQADLRMISRRTGKWTIDDVEKICYDIVKLAEAKYLDHVDVGLFYSNYTVLRAVRFTVALDGKSMKGDRAGGNDWPDINNTHLSVILHYSSSWHKLSEEEKNKYQYDNHFKNDWVTSNIDTTYSSLKRENAQTYGSKGYELIKTNFI